MVKLSKTSKLGCLSWSLQAIDTCPGSVAPDGGLVEACKGCYATTGNYRYPNVKAPREFNREDWKRDEWVSDMVAALNNERFFRWFDSGDCYSVALAEKIFNVVKATPWVNHWMPTRMMKFAKFVDVLSKLNSLPNCVVRQSADEVYTDQYVPAQGFVSGIVAHPAVKTTAKVCGAYANDGKCGTCRACWDKTVPAIAYPAHGQKMEKVIMLRQGNKV